jgi:hypothetical protein
LKLDSNWQIAYLDAPADQSFAQFPESESAIYLLLTGTTTLTAALQDASPNFRVNDKVVAKINFGEQINSFNLSWDHKKSQRCWVASHIPCARDFWLSSGDQQC